MTLETRDRWSIRAMDTSDTLNPVALPVAAATVATRLSH